MTDGEPRKINIQASQFRRQSTWAENEHQLFMEDAKKDSLSRFFTVVKKYDISEDDIKELIEVSQFLI